MATPPKKWLFYCSYLVQRENDCKQVQTCCLLLIFAIFCCSTKSKNELRRKGWRQTDSLRRETAIGFCASHEHQLKFLVCVCLQETRIKNNTDIQFKNYSAYHCPGSVTDGIVHGGVANLVNNSLAHKSITLDTHLQAVAVRVSCHKTITVCSLYLSPSLGWTKRSLRTVI